MARRRDISIHRRRRNTSIKRRPGTPELDGQNQQFPRAAEQLSRAANPIQRIAHRRRNSGNRKPPINLGNPRGSHSDKPIGHLRNNVGYLTFRDNNSRHPYHNPRLPPPRRRQRPPSPLWISPLANSWHSNVAATNLPSHPCLCARRAHSTNVHTHRSRCTRSPRVRPCRVRNPRHSNRPSNPSRRRNTRQLPPQINPRTDGECPK